MNSRRWKLLVCCALVVPMSACSSAVRMPRFVGPGPAGFQRANAEDFDPYPQGDVGPEIVGGRPLDYQVPVDEVTRARQTSPLPWPKGPPVVPAVPGMSPIVAPNAPPPIVAPIAAPVAAPFPPPVQVPITRY